MEQKILTEYEKWLTSDKVSEEMKAELVSIRDNEEEMKEAEKAVIHLWNIGKVVTSERGE